MELKNLKDLMEKYQVIIYLVFISLGLLFGIFFEDVASKLDVVLWFMLGGLLFTTFTQVPLSHIKDALKDTRFLSSAILGNFILIPLFVFALLQFTPNNEAIRLGILLVLLLPCTDWFITFTDLGGGDTKHAIAFSPVSLILQIVLLPFYLWLFFGGEFATALVQKEMIFAFVFLIIIPLFLAFIFEKWVDKKSKHRQKHIIKFSYFPVPLLAFVVFIISASQVNVVINEGKLLLLLTIIFVLFLLGSILLAFFMKTLFKLPVKQGRTLAYSFGTRNSFVILPLAITLPEPFAIVVVIVVFQSLIELLGMVFYLWFIPKKFV